MEPVVSASLIHSPRVRTMGFLSLGGNVCEEFLEKQQMLAPSFDLTQENRGGLLLFQDRQRWLKDFSVTIFGVRESRKPTKSRPYARSRAGAERLEEAVIRMWAGISSVRKGKHIHQPVQEHHWLKNPASSEAQGTTGQKRTFASIPFLYKASRNLLGHWFISPSCVTWWTRDGIRPR